MTHLQRAKLFAYGAFTVISALEVFLFCALFHATPEQSFTFFSIVIFVIVFNSSVWWFRKVYDRVLLYYAQKSKEES